MATPPATVADFKAQFPRGFVYGTGTDSVRDADITAAISEAMLFWNECLWPTAQRKVPFCYAVAHLLVTALQAAGGLSALGNNKGAKNRAAGSIISASVGSVSKSLQAPPPWVAKSSFLLQFWMTDFGQKYLAMLGPRLVGNVGLLDGPHSAGTSNAEVPFA